MRTGLIVAIGITLLLCSEMTLALNDSIEIRGPVAKVVDGAKPSWGPQYFSGDFSGFYYDIDNNLGAESITMTITGNMLDGNAEPKGVVYRTDAQEKAFKFSGWGWYNSIGFMGDNYFAGYVSREYNGLAPLLYKNSEDSNVLQSEQLLKVLYDDDTERTVQSGQSFKLGDGYELAIRSIDIDGNKVFFDLLKNGQTENSSVVIPSNRPESIDESTYTLKKDVGNVKGIITIGVHFKNAFKGVDRDLTTIDGVFQVSDSPTIVTLNTQYDKMRVASVSPSSITMDNRDNSIMLSKSMDTILMMGIHIKAADQNFTQEDPLRFYIYKKISEPGTHEIRGRVADVVDGAEISWDTTDFPGFFYDLDNNLGAEKITIRIAGDILDSSSSPKGIVYRTDAQENAFKCQDWGRYYSIGFLGEKYLAGYIGGRSALGEASEEKNLMVTGQISKVLIDDDEERPISSGSSFALKEGYELRINSIDQDGRKVLLTLVKDGAEVDKDKVVVLDNAERWSYFYKKNIGSANNIVTIAVHFKNAYYSNESKLVTIDGIWQISDTATGINPGTKIDKMTISNVDFREGEMSVEMDNRDSSITLGKNKRVQLMKDFFIRTADQDDVTISNPLRFYVYRAVTIGSPVPLPTGTSVPASADESASAMTGTPVPVSTDESASAKPAPAVPSAPGRSPGFEGVFAIIGIMAGAFLVLGKKK